MPRPTLYDRQTALTQAMQLFWSQGYHASSLKQLEQAMDMRPGSLYAAFGNKRSLFLEALDHYVARLRQTLEINGGGKSRLDVLQEFVRQAVPIDPGPVPASACLAVKTLLEATTEEPELLAHADSALARMEAAFEDLLRAAQSNGELRPEVDCQHLARRIQVQVMGLQSYARRNVPGSVLQALVDELITLIDQHRASH